MAFSTRDAQHTHTVIDRTVAGPYRISKTHVLITTLIVVLTHTLPAIGCSIFNCISIRGKWNFVKLRQSVTGELKIHYINSFFNDNGAIANNTHAHINVQIVLCCSSKFIRYFTLEYFSHELCMQIDKQSNFTAVEPNHRYYICNFFFHRRFLPMNKNECVRCVADEGITGFVAFEDCHVTYVLGTKVDWFIQDLMINF